MKLLSYIATFAISALVGFFVIVGLASGFPGTDQNVFCPASSPGNPCNGTSDKDTMYGSDCCKDYINGKGDQDLIRPFDGGDEANGDNGADLLYGGNGSDELRGGAGDELWLVTGGYEGVNGQSGGDSLYGGPDTDLVKDHEGQDDLYGGDNNDDLNALDGSGGDYLNGGSGPDACSKDGGDTAINC